MHHDDYDHGPVFLRIYQDRDTQSLHVGCDRFKWHLLISLIMYGILWLMIIHMWKNNNDACCTKFLDQLDNVIIWKEVIVFFV